MPNTYFRECVITCLALVMKLLASMCPLDGIQNIAGFHRFHDFHWSPSAPLLSMVLDLIDSEAAGLGGINSKPLAFAYRIDYMVAS